MPEPVFLGIAGLTDAYEVGRGGFAVVYRAEQPTFDRTVAVKVLNTVPDTTSLERFNREIRSMGKLSEHPAIATVLDAGTTADGRPYLLMPFLSGGSLQDALNDGRRFTSREAAELGVALASALAAAHAEGILHRDVKPANVMVGRYGDPLLVDFGIARIAGGHQTTTGVVTATLGHAAPELLDGKPPSVASDIYALGSTLHMLMTGRLPFSAQGDQSVISLIARIVGQPVPPLPDEVPSSLQAVIHRAMARSPEDRFGSAEEFAKRLAASESPGGVTPFAPAAPAVEGRDEATRIVLSHDAESPLPLSEVPAHEPSDAAVEQSALTTPAGKGRRYAALAAGVGVVIALVIGGLFERGGGRPEPRPSTDVVVSEEADPDVSVEPAGDGGGQAVALNGVDEVELALLDAPTSTASIDPNTVLEIGIEEFEATALTFDVAQPGQALRIATAQTGDLDPIVGVYRDGELVGADDDGSEDTNVLLDLPLAPPGPYEMRFASIDEQSGSLSVSLRVEQVRTLSSLQDSLDDVHDVHVYQVELEPGDGQRGLTVTTELELELRVVSGNGTFVDFTAGDDGTLELDLAAIASERYYVYVSAMNGETTSYQVAPF